MAVAFRSASFGGGASGTSVTGTAPAGTVQDDAMLALYLVNASSATCAAPAGWTTLHSGSLGLARWVVAIIARGASAPSMAFTHTGTVYRELQILTFSGCDTTTPVDASAAGTATNANPNNPNPPAVTSVTAGALPVALGLSWVGSGSGGWTAQSGYTIRAASNVSGGDTTVSVRNAALGAAGTAEDPAAFSNAGAGASDGVAFTVLLRPAGATTTQVSATRRVTYDVQAQVASTRRVTYNVQAQVAATRRLVYAVLAAVVVTRRVSYSVMANVAGSRRVVYSVAAGTTQVAASRRVVYSVAAQVSATRRIRYDTLAAVVAQRRVVYGVSKAVAATRRVSYGVSANVTAPRHVVYTVGEASSTVSMLPLLRVG